MELTYLNPLSLRPPAPEDEKAFFLAYNASRISNPNFAHFYEEGMTYSKWLEVLRRKHAGIDLESGVGPSTFLLAWVDGKIVGRLTFRHWLEEPLLKERGHIGYVVIPEYQRKGYATEMLRLALPIAKGVGLERVLLTCDQGNIGSEKTIERCGGVFESLYEVQGEAVPKKLYWIELK